jgi:hypothetical protein
MKKFSDFKPVKSKRVNEADETGEEMVKANLPENIEGQEETQEVESTEEGSVSKFFSKLFESREMAHIYHLQVRGDEGSYAAHTSLNEYYEGILGIIDELIETYQGQYGLIEEYDVIDTSETKTKERITYFEDLVEYIKHARKCISIEDTHLHSIIDDFVVLAYKTLYKLKFTK